MKADLIARLEREATGIDAACGYQSGEAALMREAAEALRERSQSKARPKVVAAFVAPDTSAWQSRCVNVTEDGAWHTFNNGRWDADLPPLSKEQP